LETSLVVAVEDVVEDVAEAVGVEEVVVGPLGPMEALDAGVEWLSVVDDSGSA